MVIMLNNGSRVLVLLYQGLVFGDLSFIYVFVLYELFNVFDLNFFYSYFFKGLFFFNFLKFFLDRLCPPSEVFVCRVSVDSSVEILALSSARSEVRVTLT